MSKFKLYSTVIVDRGDYHHYGEILSHPIPPGVGQGGGDTYMVRMVPGHTGTLLELPADKLQHAQPGTKLRWVHYAEVDGNGSFPIDMLRYDFAAPLNFDPETLEIEPSFGFAGLVIAQASARREPRWTRARWSSFLWGLQELKSEAFTPGGVS